MSETAEKKDKAVMQEKDMQKVTETTAQILAKQKKVKVKLYLSTEDRQKLEAAVAAKKNVQWPYETVQINGYTYQIQRGKEVEVPESVYEVLSQANII
jgi:hypothetical protein